MTVVGTRPEIIRLSRVIALLDRHCRHVLVHTGQNFHPALSDVFFRDLQIRQPDHFLSAAGESPAITIGQVIIATDRILAKEQPDALLILGDTNSCLAAIAAKRRKVPIFHMEAGNRCFDTRVPEEINRRLVDHIADINLTYSAIAREHLLREGLPPDCIIKTGSPMREVLEHSSEGIRSSDVLDRLGLKPRSYFVVSAHREENVDPPANLRRIFAVLEAIAARYDQPIVFSTHPRTQRRIDEFGLKAPPLVSFQAPFGFFDYVRLQSEARAVISDSGTITEESSILNFPALNLREVHERPEGFEEAAVMLTGLDAARVLECLSVIDSQPRGETRLLRPVADYEPANVSAKVLRIILSYEGFVRRRSQ